LVLPTNANFKDTSQCGKRQSKKHVKRAFVAFISILGCPVENTSSAIFLRWIRTDIDGYFHRMGNVFRQKIDNLSRLGKKVDGNIC
jgi:hypothetical protein